MRHIRDTSLAAKRLEGTIEYFKVFGLEAAANGCAAFFDVFNRIKFFDVGDDAVDLAGRVVQQAQSFGHGAIDDFQHASAGQQFVFHQRDVRLDASRVAVPEKGDGAGGSEDGDLGIAI